MAGGAVGWLQELRARARREISERVRAGAALRRLNDELEIRVAGRTQELAEALADLEAAQKNLVQQERLSALGQMASGVAHDFDNSLTPIVGFSELLLERPELLDDKAEALEYLRAINRAAVGAGGIVRRLREFYRSRDQQEAFAPTDLNKLVEDTIKLTEYAWKERAHSRGGRIAVEAHLEPLPHIQASEAELTRVVTNLMLNATDAIAKDGTITIRTYPEERGVVLEIEDTGVGMTEEVRQRCFEPFFTTKGDEGTGLGLAGAYGIVKRHNGAIDVESEPGKGTTLRIWLPLEPEAEASEVSPPA